MHTEWVIYWIVKGSRWGQLAEITTLVKTYLRARPPIDRQASIAGQCWVYLRNVYKSCQKPNGITERLRKLSRICAFRTFIIFWQLTYCLCSMLCSYSFDHDSQFTLISNTLSSGNWMREGWLLIRPALIACCLHKSWHRLFVLSLELIGDRACTNLSDDVSERGWLCRVIPICRNACLKMCCQPMKRQSKKVRRFWRSRLTQLAFIARI